MAQQAAVQQQLMAAANMVESYVDKELTRLDNLDGDELEMIRQNRLKELKRMENRKEEWINIGHGKYEEIQDEKDFFEQQKKSERVVCHFYRSATERCKIFDKHLEIIAKKHMETRFLKIDAEKCIWLCQKLQVKVLPAIVCIKDNKTRDLIVGFDDLGGRDDFPTEMLAWRLGVSEMINHSGEKPELKKSGKMKEKPTIFGHAQTKKNLRGRMGDDDEDDSDFSD